MKRSLILAVGLTLLLTSVALAASFTVGSTLPQGGLTTKITAVQANSPYDGSTDSWTALPAASDLSFGTLAELVDPVTGPLGVFGPSDRRYYAIDIAIGGGGGLPTTGGVSVVYTPGANDAGNKYVAAFVGITWAAPPVLPSAYVVTPLIANKLLTNVNEDFTPLNTYFSGKWVRMYLGIVTNPAGAGMPAGAQAFTGADAAQAYTGTLAITLHG